MKNYNDFGPPDGDVYKATVSTPQFRNDATIHLKQKGIINTATWIFKGEQHNINFHTKEAFLKAQVK